MPIPYIDPEAPMSPVPAPVDPAAHDAQRESEFLAQSAAQAPSPANVYEAFQYKLAYPEADLTEISKSLDKYRQQAVSDQVDWGRVVKQHPTLAKYLRDPEQMPLALRDSAFLTGYQRFTGKFTSYVDQGKPGEQKWGYVAPGWLERGNRAWDAGLGYTIDKLAAMPWEVADWAVGKAVDLVKVISGAPAAERPTFFLDQARYWNARAAIYEPFTPAKNDYVGNSFRESNKFVAGFSSILQSTAEMSPILALGTATEAVSGARGLLALNTAYSAPGIYEKTKAETGSVGEAAALTAVGAPIVGKIMGASPLGSASGRVLMANYERAMQVAAAEGAGIMKMSRLWLPKVGIDVAAGQMAFGAQRMAESFVGETAKAVGGKDVDLREPLLEFFRGVADPSMLGLHAIGIAREAGRFRRGVADARKVRDWMKEVNDRWDEMASAFRSSAGADISGQHGAETAIYVPMDKFHEAAEKLGADPGKLAATLHGDGGETYAKALAAHEADLVVPAERSHLLAKLGLTDLVTAEGRLDPRLEGARVLQERQDQFNKDFEAALKLDPEKMEPQDRGMYEAVKSFVGGGDESAAKHALASLTALRGQHPEMTPQQIFDAVFGPGGLAGPAPDSVTAEGQPADKVKGVGEGIVFRHTEARDLPLHVEVNDPFGDYKDHWSPAFFDVEGRPEDANKRRAALKGKGIATTLYLRALKEAQKAGAGWVSDKIRSDATNRMYPRLTELGIPFKVQSDTPTIFYDKGESGTRKTTFADRYAISPEELQRVSFPAIEQAIKEKYGEVGDVAKSPSVADTIMAPLEREAGAQDPRWFNAFQDEQAKVSAQAAAKEAREAARQKLLDALKAGTRAYLPEERAKAEERAREDIRKDLVYRALHWFQKGELWGDTSRKAEITHPESGKPLRLLASEVDSLMGPGTAEAIKANKRGIITDDPAQSIDVDGAANALGFTGTSATGDPARRMLAGLRDALSEGQYVKQLADLRLKETYGGDLFENPRALMEAALDAAHDEKQVGFLQRVYRSLAKSLDPLTQARSVMTPEMWDAAARKIINEKRLERTDPEIFARAAFRHSQRALDALGENKTRPALDATEGAILHHYLYKVARELHDDLAPKWAEIGRKAGSLTAQRRLGYADPGDIENGKQPVYLPAHDAVIYAIGLRDAPEGYEPSPTVIADLLQRAKENSHDQMFSAPTTWDPAVIQDIVSKGTHWSQLTPEQALQVHAMITNLHHVALRDAQESAALNGARIQESRNGIMTYVRGGKAGESGTADLPPPYPRYLSRGVERMDKEGGVVGMVKAPLRWLGKVSDALGWSKDVKLAPWNRLSELGPKGEEIYQGFMDRRNDRDQLLETFFKPWNEAHQKLTALPGIHEEAPGAADDLGLRSRADINRITKMDLANLARYWGDRDGRQRVAEAFHLTPDRVEAAFAKHLTPEMLDLIQQEKDIVDRTMRPLKEAKHLERTGVRLQTAEPAPFTVNGVEYKGGYHPIEYDHRPGMGTNWMQRFMMHDQRPTVPDGFMRERTGSGGTPDLSRSDLPLHMLSVAHNLAFGDFVQDAARVLLDTDVQKTIAAYQGDDAARGLKRWLARVALDVNGGPDAAFAATDGNRAARVLRQMMVRATMAGNYPVLFAHSTHPLAVAEMRHGSEYAMDYAAPAMKGVIASYMQSLSTGKNDLREFALAASPELQHMASSTREEVSAWFFDRHFDELPDARVPRAIAKTDRFVSDKLGMAHLRWMTEAFSTSIWLSEYRAQMEKEVGHDEAVRLADKEVHETMPTYSQMEQPELLADKHSFRSVGVIWRGYYEKLWQIAHDARYEQAVRPALERRAAGDDSYSLRGRDELHVFGRIAAGSALALILGAYLKGQGPERNESAPDWLIKKAVLTPSEYYPFATALAEHQYEVMHRHRKWDVALANSYFQPIERVANAMQNWSDRRSTTEDRVMQTARAGFELTGAPKPALNLGQFAYHGADWLDQQETVGGAATSFADHVFYPHRWGRSARYQPSSPLSDAAKLYNEANGGK